MGIAAWTGQSRGMGSAHQHLDLEINYVLSGAMRYLIGGALIELIPRRLCLLWGGVPHQMLRNNEAVDVIWITIPLSLVLRWKLPDTVMRPLLAGGFVADVTPRPRDLDLLHQWLCDLPAPHGRHSAASVVPRHDSTETHEIALLEIEARLRRLALSLCRISEKMDSVTQSFPYSDRGLIAVEAMAQFMSQNFSSDIHAPQIANAAHLHPNYAMVLFRQHVGMTLSGYLTMQRVAHAQRLLATTDESIIDIALSSGFGSVSRFYEAFRKKTGTSPRRFRRYLEQS